MTKRKRIEINMRVRKRLRGGTIGWCKYELHRDDEHCVGTEARRAVMWYGQTAHISTFYFQNRIYA